MFNYKKFSLPKIFTIFFSYSTNKTESPCANSRYSQCLNCFSYLLPAVPPKLAFSLIFFFLLFRPPQSDALWRCDVAPVFTLSVCYSYAWLHVAIAAQLLLGSIIQGVT